MSIMDRINSLVLNFPNVTELQEGVVNDLLHERMWEEFQPEPNSEAVTEFQGFADEQFAEFAKLLLGRRTRQVRSYLHLVAELLVGLAFWPLGWVSSLAGVVAMLLLTQWIADRSSDDRRYIRAAINVAQAKQDAFHLGQLGQQTDKIGELGERLERVEFRAEEV